MANIRKRNGVFYWLDSRGIEVPEDYIPAQDKKRDALVTKLVDRARKLAEHTAKEKAAMSTEIGKYLDSVADDYDMDWKGNALLYSFDMTEAIDVKVNRKYTFDENLSLAKALIDECIRSWSPGSNEKIIALVNRAFRVDSGGHYNTQDIVGLRQLEFSDPMWQEAMELISKSMKVIESKTYFNFKEADDSGELVSITLNFSKI